MKKTWKPVAAGILEIIAGGLSVITGCGLYMSAIVANFLTTVPPLVYAALTYPVLPLILLGLLAIAGGVCALLRKAWGLALAGAIGGFFVAPLLCLFAIIFTAISKKEFA
ncbi:MAG: hypothetical protein JW901_09670 [Dehalococcoidia bacterium]|nr:hypothetical protein [Dehalococcoidia bacterium]